MNLNAITMECSQARQFFLDYRRAVKARHNDEDELLMRGYRQLALGKQLLNVPEAIQLGGLDENRRPKIALARADWAQTFVDGGDNRFSFKAERGWLSDRSRKQLRIAWPGSHWDMKRGVAITPNVPPALRPKGDLKNYHILFEAEWRDVQPVAPTDPALLKHLHGDLYVVLAVWNLTPLEKAVLGVTRQ